MLPFVSDAQLEISGYTVNVGAHQWGFSDGADYLERRLGETPYGVIHRQKYGIKVRDREVRFVKSDALIEQLRRVVITTALTGADVKFTPDVAVPGTFWWVVWPTVTEFGRIIENREELVVRLREQSAGA